MIDLLEESPVDNAMIATVLLAQAGLPTMEGSCECGYCPIEIEEFKIGVQGILIRANGRTYHLLASPLLSFIDNEMEVRDVNIE